MAHQANFGTAGATARGSLRKVFCFLQLETALGDGQSIDRKRFCLAAKNEMKAIFEKNLQRVVDLLALGTRRGGNIFGL